MEANVVDKVGEVISKVHKAKNVDDVVLAVHSLALLLFPLDSTSISGKSYYIHVELYMVESHSEFAKVFCNFFSQ